MERAGAQVSREWREDDPLNGPRCLTSAFVWCLLVGGIALVAMAAHCVEAPVPDAPSVARRQAHAHGTAVVETYGPDERMMVHNSASRDSHRGWMARHPRVLGAIIVGAGVGVGAGIAISHRRGICTEHYANGYTYVGTNPCPGGEYK